MSAQPLPRFVRFLVVGAAAAAINVAMRALFSLYVPFELAVVLAFPVALTFAFVANRQWVFVVGPSRWTTAYARFAVVNIAALLQVWLVSVLLVRLVFPALDMSWHAELIGHTLGVLSPVVTSYFAHKHYSFKSAAL